MARLLFLAHRIPYPPDKGDKIRSWHFLRHLAGRHEVHLGAFVDDLADWEGATTLETVCASVCLRPLGLLQLGPRSLAALATGRALSLNAYSDAGLRGWVDARIAGGIDVAFAFSGAAALPLLARRHRPGVVLDLVDCDSAKWEARASAAAGPVRWLFRREARLVLAFERQAAAELERVVLVSDAEAGLFERRVPEMAPKVTAVANGVDTGYFDPETVFANPYPADARSVLVFTGVMDYAPNVEAVTWFVRDIMPRLTRQERPRLAIVGARPSRAVQGLARDTDVIVTGRVPDVRPYLQHATVAIAPLRLARGLQNKVLEAMAMGLPVVATGAAREGLSAEDERDLLVADTAAAFAAAIDRLLDEPPRRQALGRAARAYVLARHGWSAQLARLDAVIDDVLAQRRRMATAT